MKLSLVMAAALALSSTASAEQGAQPSAEARQIGRALERGRLLFDLDRAAWVATDDLLKRVPDAEAKGVRGYIVEQQPNGFLVTFFARDGERFVAAYRAQVRAGGVERPEAFDRTARPVLTPVQLRLARAFETAHERGAKLQRCGSDPFNVAIVPPQTADGPLDVYLMTPQTAAGFPIGGHHRITLDAAGKEMARRSFARSCLRMAKTPDLSGGQPVGMVVTHLLDPVPTELHVFTALAAEVPVYVATSGPRRLFEVSGAGIRTVETPGGR